MELDEHEKNIRKVLNLGHTFAHAYEASQGYSKQLNHGEAVIYGIKTAAKFSQIVGADINELSPIKGFNCYNFLVAKLAYKIISYSFEYKKIK